MPESPRKLKVFLCHASQDKPVARELYQKLLAEGWIDPWLDQEKLLPGQDWDMEIEKAVETSHIILVCLSKESVSKEGYVQKELRFALDVALNMPEGVIFIVPLRLDECESPRRLRTVQHVDYFAENRPAAHEKLLASLQIRARSLKIPVRKRAQPKPTPGSKASQPDLDAITPQSGVERLKAVIAADLPAQRTALTADGLQTARQHKAFAALAQLSDPEAVAYLHSLTPREMVLIPAGEFPMGGVYSNEIPVRDVWVNSFYMARYPLTNAEYLLFIEDGGYARRECWTQPGWEWAQRHHRVHPWKWDSQCYLGRKARCPVEGLSWHEAMAYARWKALKTGALFRLPTEAEWEKAAGWDAKSHTKREYPWGNNFDRTRCNLSGAAIQPVGHFSPAGDSAYGVADMAGQVWQWTSSLRKPYPYCADMEHENPEEPGERVFRGGCWANADSGFARCASRCAEELPIWPFMNTRSDYEGPCGLRLALGAAPWLTQAGQ